MYTNKSAPMFSRIFSSVRSLKNKYFPSFSKSVHSTTNDPIIKKRINLTISNNLKSRRKQKPKGYTKALESINTQIQEMVCLDTIKQMNDVQNLCLESPSVKRNIDDLKDLLLTSESFTTTDLKHAFLMDNLAKYLIPAGTKGALRGKKFNDLVKKNILELDLSESRFEIKFEEKCKQCLTYEIPDWYIHDALKNKTLIGMNQMDLWGGGQQLNRGFKYLIENKLNTNKTRILCVVCNDVIIKSKNKVYKLLTIGIKNNTICYMTNLEKTIINYFM
jgi:hypothetical protein